MHDEAFFSPVIEHAIELAAQWHDITYRKNAWRDVPFELPEGEVMRVPVTVHVTTVAMTAQRAGWDEETVAAAFLHDVIEDVNRYGQRFRRERMRELVGEVVTALVMNVSEKKRDEAGQPRSWRDRKEDYIEQIRDGDPRAAAISLADKLHNLWSMNESLERGIDIFTSTPNRKALSAGPEQQLWFYESVLEATRVHDDPRLEPMRRRLERELERFTAFVHAEPDR